MTTGKRVDGHDGWACLRFAVIGVLLVSPPPAGRGGRRCRRVPGDDLQLCPQWLERPSHPRWRAAVDLMAGVMYGCGPVRRLIVPVERRP